MSVLVLSNPTVLPLHFVPMAQEPVYILSDIVKRLGEATEEEVRLEFEGLSNADFVAQGRRIGTAPARERAGRALRGAGRARPGVA
jgi:hypothetical protein